MKAVAYAALLLGLVSAALGQAETPGPSPTESYGCEPHGDHWHCEGARVTSSTLEGAATSAAAVTTSATSTHDHENDEDHEDHEEHTDAAGTGSLAPSPTESYGCEPHGDHWHCEGPVTASVSGSASSLVTTTTPPAGTGTEAAASNSPSPSTAAAPRFEVAGLGFAGIAAAAAMAF
ncbi:hypothetical protein C8A01DRAFT_35030 [Parachaetomium inaequale]|uniref:Uncharacterized protein n=1 Tax=Parachaetomium inaequale TaxID=2588326 RepID=A0AAN6PH95_9PEZI|nr:hypothetical protein C8A01DRAFT_35030 [Parachaetomium inaequale]